MQYRTNGWLVTMALAAGLVAGCGCSEAIDPGADGGGTLDGGGTTLDGALPPGTCLSDADCAGGLVCHPFSQRCVTSSGSCTAMMDCTGGTYCDTASGSCLPGTTGSPCATDANCEMVCTAGTCGCDALVEQQMLAGALDVYFILDRTGSMGTDCAYVHGDAPPVSSKACFATYALSDYLIDHTPAFDTRLAFQFMSQPSDCNGDPYLTPLVDLTALPVPATHTLITEISNETFAGGLGTHIEGALRGIAGWTAANVTPGREMIGVLMTDGDPSGCDQNIDNLAAIISDHYAATGMRTFIIGMEGATEANLETLAIAGGADAHSDYCGSIGPPCHYWNVGAGSGAAIADALEAIIAMAVPLPCSFPVTDLMPPAGETLDYDRVNVTLTEAGTTTTIGRVANAAACPTDRPAWYYDDPAAPTEIFLCPMACTTVSGAADGATVSVVVGCQDTVVIF